MTTSKPQKVERPFPNPTPERVRAFNASIPRFAEDDPMFWEPERLQARRDELLRRQLEWIAAGSAHYQKVFADLGTDPSSITSTADLAQLPITTKADLMADADSFRLQLPDAGLYDRTYATVFTTGTTSGIPTRYEYTTHDYFGYLASARRIFKAQGLQPGDVMLSAYPLSPVPHVASFGPPGAMTAGLAVVSAASGVPYPEFPIHQPAAAIPDLIETARPDALMGIGSFVRRMAQDAGTASRDFSSIQVVHLAGEVMTARMFDHLRGNLERCGAHDVHITSGYGCTESAIGWVLGYEGGPLYSTAPDQVLLEVVDPDTHELLPDGEAGLLLLTHLNRRGMPLLRYAMGDIAAITHERCPRTGWQGEAILVTTGSAHVTRTNDLLNIKATLVNPQAIHHVVMSSPAVTEYRIIVTHHHPDDPLSGDALHIEVGLEPGTDERGWLTAHGTRLQLDVQATIEVTPVIDIVPMSTIYDPAQDFKAQRVIDRRQLH